MEKPPCTLTPQIALLIGEVSELLGRYRGVHAPVPNPRLRKNNTARTIQGSVAIEGNSLALQQVTALLDNKRVIGRQSEILEVQNAIALYELLPSLNIFQPKDLLRAHRVLMSGLVFDAGQFRRGAVGIFKGRRVAHVAPSAKRVPTLVAALLRYAKYQKTLPRVVVACIVHYELEFIHPFSDGNGRIGRAWQTALLMRENKAFAFTPVESIIHARQKAYYQALAAADRLADAAPFVEFSLQAIRDALREFLAQLAPTRHSALDRLALAKDAFGTRTFNRADYLRYVGAISTATASRDLALGAKQGQLRAHYNHAQTTYQFCV